MTNVIWNKENTNTWQMTDENRKYKYKYMTNDIWNKENTNTIANTNTNTNTWQMTSETTNKT